LLDREISSGDSYLAARITTRRRWTSGSGDGIGTAVIESTRGTDDYYVEAGYGPTGEFRFSLYYSGSAQRPPSAPALTRAVGDLVTVYDAAGGVISTASFDNLMYQMGLPGGSLAHAVLGGGGGGGGGGGEGPCLGCVIIEGGSEGDPEITVTGDVKQVRTVIEPGGAEVTATAPAAEVVRSYQRIRPAGGRTEAEYWRLFEVHHRAGDSENIQRFEYTAWNRNPAKDRARERSRSERPSAYHDRPRPVPQSQLSPSRSDFDPAFISCGTEADQRDRTIVPGAHSIVYQHGICSGAGTWDGMAPALANQLLIGRERAFSLPSLAYLNDQTTELINHLDASGGGSSVVVGHSQGGLIARRLAHRRPDLVRGVITVGTPHQGARVANAAPAALAHELQRQVNEAICFSKLCRDILTLSLAPVIDQIVYGAVDQVTPVRENVAPGSFFLDSLSSHHEPFLRAGIESDAGFRWALYRIAGDAVSSRTRLLDGARPHGETVVWWVGGLVNAAAFLDLLSSLAVYDAYPFGGGVDCMAAGYSTYWVPCIDVHFHTYWYQSAYWVTLIAALADISNRLSSALIRLDRYWDVVTTGGIGDTDGFIQFDSQRYPNSSGAHVPDRYVIRGADSHTGSTASPMVRDGLRTLLSQRMEFDESQIP
jgi:pimeloyl-ACP methyl ester carboxylesterase